MFGIEVEAPGAAEGDEGVDAANDDADNLTGNDEWRYPEFRLLRETPTDDYLTASDPGIHESLKAALSRSQCRGPARDARASRVYTRSRRTP